MPVQSFSRASVTPDTYELTYVPFGKEPKIVSDIETFVKTELEKKLNCTLENADAEQNPYGIVWKHNAFRNGKIGTVWIIKPHRNGQQAVFTIKIFRDNPTYFPDPDMIVYRFFH